jgi:Fe-S-cluster containining protein
MSLKEKPVSECDKCGACCRTYPILVSIGDATREPRIKLEALQLPEWRRTDEWEYQLHPLPFLDGCPFLSSEKTCSVYDTRPDPCRRFSAGSPECDEARSRVGLPKLLSL